MGTILLVVFCLQAQAMAKDIQNSADRSIASMKRDIRQSQGRELMGKYYSRSDIRYLEEKTHVDEYVFKLVKKFLPAKFKSQSKQIAQAIIDESFRNELDPFFVMAVIGGESSFNPIAEGPVGEIGMMQLRSSTGKWMAEMRKMDWNGKKTLEDPILNIKLGAAYLKWLRTKFEGHGRLYVSAYNMGPGNLKDALSRNKWPKDYAQHVMKRYLNYYELVKEETQNLLKKNVEILSSLHVDYDYF